MTRKQNSRKRSAAHLDDDMVDLPGVHRHEDALRVRPLRQLSGAAGNFQFSRALLNELPAMNQNRNSQAAAAHVRKLE